MGVVHGLAQPFGKLVGGEFLALEIFFHQRVVGFGREFDQVILDGLHAVLEFVGDFVGRAVENIDGFAVGGREHHGDAAVVAPALFDFQEGVVKIGVVLVEAGDGDAAGEVALFAGFPCTLGADLNTGAGVDGDEGGVGDFGGSDHLADEVGEAGGVEHDQAADFAACGGVYAIERLGPNRDFVRFFFVGPIGHTGTVPRRTYPINLTQLKQDTVDQRSFPATRVAH